MSRKAKAILLAVVALLAAGVLVKPYLPAGAGKQAFAVTPDPDLAYQEALSAGRPVFLEFYATW